MMYKTAMELGATDEGEPGLHGSSSHNFYAAYFRDPNGHKLMFTISNNKNYIAVRCFSARYK